MMGDDGLAIAVVEHIGDDLAELSILSLICETDPFFSFALIEEGDFLIIMDAIQGFTEEMEPGSLVVIPLNFAIRENPHPVSGHEIDSLSALRTYGYQNEGCLIGIVVPPLQDNMSLEFSQPIQDRFEEICQNTRMTLSTLSASFLESAGETMTPMKNKLN